MATPPSTASTDIFSFTSVNLDCIPQPTSLKSIRARSPNDNKLPSILETTNKRLRNSRSQQSMRPRFRSTSGSLERAQSRMDKAFHEVQAEMQENKGTNYDWKQMEKSKYLKQKIGELQNHISRKKRTFDTYKFHNDAKQLRIRDLRQKLVTLKKLHVNDQKPQQEKIPLTEKKIRYVMQKIDQEAIYRETLQFMYEYRKNCYNLLTGPCDDLRDEIKFYKKRLRCEDTGLSKIAEYKSVFDNQSTKLRDDMQGDHQNREVLFAKVMDDYKERHRFRFLYNENAERLLDAKDDQISFNLQKQLRKKTQRTADLQSKLLMYSQYLEKRDKQWRILKSQTNVTKPEEMNNYLSNLQNKEIVLQHTIVELTEKIEEQGKVLDNAREELAALKLAKGKIDKVQIEKLELPSLDKQSELTRKEQALYLKKQMVAEVLNTTSKLVHYVLPENKKMDRDNLDPVQIEAQLTSVAMIMEEMLNCENL